MNKKMTLLTVGLVVVTGLAISSLLSRQKAPMRRKPPATGKKQVPLLTVENRDIPIDLEFSGPLSALDKIDIYAEVSGVLLKTPKRFKEGVSFPEGETLIRIDDGVYRNTVLAQKSSLMNQLTLLLPDFSIDFPRSAPRWETYLRNFDVNQPLPPLPETETDQERYYIASRNIFSQFYTIRSMEATLAKYIITAPYEGMVTESNINPGTLVRVGQKLGEFTSTETYEMEAYVGLNEVGHLKVGQSVNLTSEDSPGTFEGRIQRINAVIDRNSQTVKVYITTRDRRLKDGMYLTALVKGDPISNAYPLSKDLLIGENQLFVVEGSALKLKRVDVISDMNNTVIIRGLEDGTRIPGEVPPDAYEGMILDRPKTSSSSSSDTTTR